VAGDKIPSPDHVSRYCKPTSCEDGLPKGAAFFLRPDEDYLSVNWLERTGAVGVDDQISAVRNHFQSKGYKLAATAVFAILNVGKTTNHVFSNSPDKRQLSFVHVSLPDDPTHSGIYGYAAEVDELIADLIAQTIVETKHARQS
jgi:hypothetical protein